MNSRRSALFAASLLALGLAASAASGATTASGIIERAEGLSFCMQGTHVITDFCSGTSTLLESSVLDLDKLLCTDVEVSGPDVGVECPVIDVQQVRERMSPVCATCKTGLPGACADGFLARGPAYGACGFRCEPLRDPSPESCNGLDDDCDGIVDEGGICPPCVSGDADGDGACDGADDCLGFYNPGQDDSDDDGEGDACDLTVMSPSPLATLDCRPGAAPPTIVWLPGTSDRYKVQISTTGEFSRGAKITSGDVWLGTTWWTVPRRKWRRACEGSDDYLYIRLVGVDMNARGRPRPMVFSGVVQAEAAK